MYILAESLCDKKLKPGSVIRIYLHAYISSEYCDIASHNFTLVTGDSY